MLSSRLNVNLNLKLLEDAKNKREKVIEAEAFVAATDARREASDKFLSLCAFNAF